MSAEQHSAAQAEVQQARNSLQQSHAELSALQVKLTSLQEQRDGELAQLHDRVQELQAATAAGQAAASQQAAEEVEALRAHLLSEQARADKAAQQVIAVLYITAMLHAGCRGPCCCMSVFWATSGSPS